MNPERCRAKGTASTRTPWVGQHPRRSPARSCTPQRPKSRCRHARGHRPGVIARPGGEPAQRARQVLASKPDLDDHGVRVGTGVGEGHAAHGEVLGDLTDGAMLWSRARVRGTFRLGKDLGRSPNLRPRPVRVLQPSGRVAKPRSTSPSTVLIARSDPHRCRESPFSVSLVAVSWWMMGVNRGLAGRHLACVVDDARSRPTRYNPRGYDMSVIVPGSKLARLPTAHGRQVAGLPCLAAL